jgi:hypothetical protein
MNASQLTWYHDQASIDIILGWEKTEELIGLFLDQTIDSLLWVIPFTCYLLDFLKNPEHIVLLLLGDTWDTRALSPIQLLLALQLHLAEWSESLLAVLHFIISCCLQVLQRKRNLAITIKYKWYLLTHCPRGWKLPAFKVCWGFDLRGSWRFWIP